MSARFYLILMGCVWALLGCESGGTTGVVRGGPAPSTSAPTASASPTAVATLVNGPGNSAVAQAHARVVAEGLRMSLIILDASATGVERKLYDDLRTRNIRATAGPDEGIDTQSFFCYPYCVFVPAEEVNAIGVERWADVLRHEHRHMVQASNNPQMAADFRTPDGTFTTYAAFMEACADFGINVAEFYHAQERMDQLRTAIDDAQHPQIERACSGHKDAYAHVMQTYNQKQGSEQAFGQLFPTYR